jgi:hypothetical protein
MKRAAEETKECNQKLDGKSCLADLEVKGS